jgi:hypothetical protein
MYEYCFLVVANVLYKFKMSVVGQTMCGVFGNSLYSLLYSINKSKVVLKNKVYYKYCVHQKSVGGGVEKERKKEMLNM